MEHFGVKVRDGKYGLELNREQYAIIDKRNSFREKFPSMADCYEDEEGKFYTDAWCQNHRQKCLKNFDLSMKFFSELDYDEFDDEITCFLEKYKQFVEVRNLWNYNEISGYYLMVLDDYCQIYIGTSTNIKKRIQSHWSSRLPFDRLLFPMNAVETSVMSIDAFRALDTTRLFVYETDEIFAKENLFISEFSPKFVTNRIGGGKLEGGLLDGIPAPLTMKYKKL